MRTRNPPAVNDQNENLNVGLASFSGERIVISFGTFIVVLRFANHKSSHRCSRDPHAVLLKKATSHQQGAGVMCEVLCLRECRPCRNHHQNPAPQWTLVVFLYSLTTIRLYTAQPIDRQ
ncbi:hypothetical protein BV22DRAFT_691850 [Leucogyrophana mollusca]|uniref:Uncharacterized protein n=1 Tax=Leucogyrophana mollusca TaxID=85980 RepID=A0ACB8B7Z6_9AGAM|nr:hypothetical protein BV22DRAFT_691850 [Leucogyrophana mollusca]